MKGLTIFFACWVTALLVAVVVSNIAHADEYDRAGVENPMVG